MKKLRFLCIAPYEGMYHLMTNIAAQRGDVCWDDAARQRVENIHGYYTDPETLAKRIEHLGA